MVRHAADPTVVATCECCGVAFATPQRGPSRPIAKYCSHLCYRYAKWGAWAEPWPKHEPKAKQPKPVKQPLTERECNWCGSMFTPERKHGRYCSRHCMSRTRMAARRALEVGATGTYTWAEITRLWINFGKRCAYCREVVPLNEIQAEHVVALNKGGSNSYTNMLPSCAYCNGDKRDLSLDEWANDRLRRGKPPVVTTWGASDPLYRHLTSTVGRQ